MSLDPPDWPDFRAQSHRMLDGVLDYIEHIRERPVWQPIPDDVRARFRAALPTAPTDLAAVHEEFLEYIQPYTTGNVHPGFMGWVHGGGTATGMLAEMLAAGLNANLGGRDHIPIEVERQIVLWMRELFGFPESATGLFVTGTSMANLIAVLIARDAALGFGVRAGGVACNSNPGNSKKLTAYASTGAHECIAKAMDISGLGSDALRTIDLRTLEQAVEADSADGFTPFLIVGTAGTVDTGAIDDLAGLADFARRHKLWFHVDGALGALAILAPDLAPRLAGIERADSLAFDFHKWAQAPYDAGFVLVRDGALHRQAFTSAAGYLRREERGLAAGADWPCDFGPDLSRGFRALKTWFTLKVFGLEALGAVISRTCALARYLEAGIAATPELELLAPVELNIVCFRYRAENSEAEADRMNARIAVELQESGIVAPSTTLIGGRLAIRAAIVNHRTGEGEIDALIENTLTQGRFLRACDLAASGKTEQARDLYLKLLAHDPSHAGALNDLGTLLHANGYLAAARTAYAEAVARRPLAPMGHVNLANMLRESGECDAARAHYETALRLDPAHPEAHQGLSYVLAEAGDEDGAALHRRAGFEVRPIAALPYRGEGPAIPILLLVSTVGGNIPVRHLLDDRVFRTFVVFPEFCGPETELPPHRLIFNSIGDADLAAPALAAASALLMRTSAPAINPPEAVLHTGRAANARRLSGLPGVVTAATETLSRELLASRDAPAELARRGFRFPLLLRTPGFHTGRHFVRVETPDGLAAALAELPGQELTVLEYLDARGPDGKVRKYRVMTIGGQLYPLHVAIANQWKVHYFTADMADRPEHRAEDAAFLENMAGVLGARAMAALAAIQRALGLDYAGIDFGLNAAGEVLLFEANATMVVYPPGPGERWAYRRPAVERIHAAVRELLTPNLFTPNLITPDPITPEN